MSKRKTNPKAVIYGRLAARNPQAEVQQLAELEALAEFLESEVVATFTDWGVSGMIRDRAGLQALLKYIECNAVDYLLMRELTRLSRNHTDVADSTSRITAAGVEIVTKELGSVSPDLIRYLDDVWKSAAACSHRRFRRVRSC